MNYQSIDLEVLYELSDETKLNEMIRESTEVNKLGALLKLKSNFVMKRKHRELALDFERIIELATVNSNLEIVKNVLLVCHGDEKFQKLFHFLNDNIKSLTTKNDEFFINIFDIGLSLSKNISDKNIKDHVADSTLNIFAYLLENNATKTHLIKNIFINLVTCTHKNVSIILHLLWNFILKNNNVEVLSALSFFLCDNEQLFVTLINDENFFVLFENNLYSGNEFDKKHVLYFLQKVCDRLFKTKKFNSSYISFAPENKKEISEAWTYFFNLSEISKEKQIHLLEPALPLLNKISILHPLWLGYIYNSFLLHSHKLVSYRTLYYLLKNNLCHDINLFQRIIKNILLVLNETEYSSYTLKSFELLQQFLNASVDNLFRIFVGNFFEMKWAPIPFYFAFKTILHCNKTLKNAEIQKLIINAEQLPNKFIRNECMSVIEKFLSKYLFENKKISLEQTINILKQSETLCDSVHLQEQIYKKFCSHKEYFINYICTKNDFRIIINIFKNSNVIKSYVECKFKDTENRFPFPIVVHMMYHFPYLIDMPIISYYLNFAFQNNVSTHDIIVLLHVIDNISVFTEANSKFVIELCCYILLNETNTHSNNIPLAFAVLIQFCNLNAIPKNEIELIIKRWKNIFKTDAKIDTHVYLCFLNLYIKEKLVKSGDNDNIIEFCDFCISFCDVLPFSSYPDLFSYLKILLEKVEENYEAVFILVEIYAHRVLEINKPCIFEKALETFLDGLILNDNQILFSQGAFVNKCLYVINTLMIESKRVTVVPVVISKILLKLSQQNPKELVHFSSVINELLLYGDLFKKDQTAEFKIYCNSDNKRKQNVFVCQINLVRINAVNILQNVLSNQNIRCTFADTLASILLDEYCLHFKKRYFKNSQIHLRKQRILQALLVLLPHIVSEKLRLIDTLMESLCLESNQISVRFLIQWILIEGTNGNHIDTISKKVNTASKIQPSAITSFVFILYCLACKMNKEWVWGKIMENMLPWTMGAHFNLRLYTQVVFVRAFEKIKKNVKYVPLETSFNRAYESIKEVIAQTDKNIDPLELYFLESFSTRDHYTLENIYITLPKITQVAETEFLSISTADFLSSELLPVQNDKKIIIDLPSDEKNEISEMNGEIDTSSLVIQQKITPPWREDVQSNTGDLILIASLVEKVPNLGGLCRTCEIFGVKSLVIRNSELKNKNEFLSLSMSSENWVDIIEVKVEKLHQYLASLKDSGVAIIGAEQTSRSIKLADFQFPKRCALLLGNEKQGIPADLLYLLDTCIEIPQVGVTRSLNVHVAASIIVWEYTKQHIL